MPFESVLLSGDGDDATGEPAPEPDFFGDLHLDDVVAAVTNGRTEYALAELFYRPLRSVEAVEYRHEALTDLENRALLDAVRAFASSMHTVREHRRRADELPYQRQCQRWFLDAVRRYCDAVTSFSERIAAAEPRSSAFTGLRDHVAAYVRSDGFTSLVAETQAVSHGLAAVTYLVQIKGNRVRVSRHDGEPDTTTEIQQTFAKFTRGRAQGCRASLGSPVSMNHVEARILDLVAELHPEAFSALESYCHRHRNFVDRTLGRFDREVQFYLSYLEYIEPLKAAGLAFCQPRVSVDSTGIHAAEAFDLALAARLVRHGRQVVFNDFVLNAPERVLVVSGPNNGGKTTFARMFGQLHYIGSLGLPVPGLDAQLLLPDRVFSHFEREERVGTLRGKFEDELMRIHEILRQATGSSVLIMNESFGSTTLRDALTVGSAVLKAIIELDAVCVFVTFVDELASLSATTVSMMSTVVADDPAIRTFKIVRRPADGLAYAAAIADKYGLSYAAVRQRFVP